MRCFARWEKDGQSGVFFRDQTILQFGDSWDLLASFVLLNPGSALPLNTESQTEFLRSLGLPFFVDTNDDEKYVEFSIDRLMNDVLKLFSSEYSGGTIRLYNLFNLKNQHSGEAVEQFNSNKSNSKMFSSNAEINYCDAPVIIASGGNAKNNRELKNELIRHIKLAKRENLYHVSRVSKSKFSIKRVGPDSTGFIESYHPSYTFKYGNTTEVGDLRNGQDTRVRGPLFSG